MTYTVLQSGGGHDREYTLKSFCERLQLSYIPMANRCRQLSEGMYYDKFVQMIKDHRGELATRAKNKAERAEARAERARLQLSDETKDYLEKQLRLAQHAAALLGYTLTLTKKEIPCDSASDTRPTSGATDSQTT